MKLKYKGKEIFEAASKEEIEKFKADFYQKERAKQLNLLQRVNALNKVKASMPGRNSLETEEEYRIRIEEQYPEFVREIQKIGNEFYGKEAELFFFDVPIGLFGYKDNCDETGFLSPLEVGGVIRKTFPEEGDFEISG